jgi:hypothetical protein
VPCVAVKVQHLSVEVEKGGVRCFVHIGESYRVAIESSDAAGQAGDASVGEHEMPA